MEKIIEVAWADLSKKERDTIVGQIQTIPPISMFERIRELEKWCLFKGLFLRITNHYSHWSIYCLPYIHGDSPFVEWWPSTKKMIFNKQYSSGGKARNMDHLMIQIEQRLIE